MIKTKNANDGPWIQNQAILAACVGARTCLAGARTFWIEQNASSIVIINLIANLSFLYHKSEKPAVNRID